MTVTETANRGNENRRAGVDEGKLAVAIFVIQVVNLGFQIGLLAVLLCLLRKLT